MKNYKINSLIFLLVFISFSLNAKEPVTSNASPEAKALLSYIYDMYGKKVLSGQMWAPWGTFDEIEKTMEITGKYQIGRASCRERV